jgi:hypothetical protein
MLIKLAVAISGVLSHGMHPIYSDEMLFKLTSFTDILQANGVEVHYFLNIDPRTYDKKSRDNEEQDIPDIDWSMSQIDRTRIETITNSGLPIKKFNLHVEKPFCPRSEICSCVPEFWPRWWEQMYKIDESYNLIVEYEKSSKMVYDWVIRARTDVDWFRVEPSALRGGGSSSHHHSHQRKDVSPADILRIMKLDLDLPVAYHKNSIFPDYGQVDFYWLVRRKHAEHTFIMSSKITCAWLKCYLDECVNCKVNERLTVDWEASHGIMMVPLVFDSLRSAHVPQTMNYANNNKRSPTSNPLDIWKLDSKEVEDKIAISLRKEIEESLDLEKNAFLARLKSGKLENIQRCNRFL